MKLKIKQGTTSKLLKLFLQDTSVTDGSGLTGVAHSDITGYWIAEGDASPTAISFSAGTTGTYSDGGWSEVDSTNMPGVYELGITNNAIDATSEGSVLIMIKGATNMAPVLCELELDAVDYRDATDFGLSNLDAAVSTRSTFDHSTNQVTVATNNDKTGYTVTGTVTTANASDVTAIKAKTDQFVFSVANQVDANAVTGSGLDAAGVRAAIGLASANLDTQIGDIPTVAEFEARTLLAADYFDAAVDTVARVTLCDTTTTNTDMVSVAGLSTFNAGTDSVTVGTNNDKTGYSIAGSKTTLDDLNDIAATAIVSGGAITTSGGAVSNVALVDTTTTNSDMITASSVADAVWDESLSGHNIAGSTAKALRQVKEGVISVEGSVNDASATATTFITNLSESIDGFYHDKIIVFVSGNLAGQARHIETYVGATKAITLSTALTSAPADTDEFLILATHQHSLNEIADSVWDELQSAHTTIGSFGYYLDARVSTSGGGGGGGADAIWNALLSDYTVAGTFGARLQEGTRYTNTSITFIYIQQGDSYDDLGNAKLQWTVTKDYTVGWSGNITIRHRVTGAQIMQAAVTIVDATTIKATLTSTDTAFTGLTTDADFGVHPYEIQLTNASVVDTVVNGVAEISKNQS